MHKSPILIAGPTASGKSALAIALAQKLGGVVINADSQQVYTEWQILSARPSEEEHAAAPHRLYGHVSIAEEYSVGHWLRDAVTVMAEVRDANLVPIFAGGTGLYFKALTEGLAPIPQVPSDIRATGELELERVGLAAFAEAFASRDPTTAEILDLDNPRRVLRAWEVLEATGTGLAGWQARTPAPLVPLTACHAVALVPDRAELYARCEARFDKMMAAGALGEVKAVDALDLVSEKPGLKAVGALPLRAHLAGEISLETAIARAKTDTRRYAKRQLTWVRNQMAAWQQISSPDPSAVFDLL